MSSTEPSRKRSMPGDRQVRPKKKRKKSRPGRFRGKHGFFTYPRCPMNKEALLQHVSDLATVVSYVVCREEHKDAGEAEELDPMDVRYEDGPLTIYHLHGYFKFSKRVEIAYSKLTLVDEDGTKYRGDYQSCRNANDVAVYCTKDGEYTSSFSAEELAKMKLDARPKQTFADVMALAKEGDVDQAFAALTRVAPRDVLLKGPVALKANLAQLDQSPIEVEESGFKFREPPLYDAWDRERYALVMVGTTGTGKSNFARKYAFKCPCVVSGTRLDGLKAFDKKRNDGIVYDEMDFGNHSPELQLQLTGVEDTVQVNVKMTFVEIPAGTPRIFVLNKFPFTQPVKPELARRIHVVAVEDDLRIRNPEQEQAQVKPPDALARVLQQFSRKAAEPEAFFYCGDK